MVTPRVALFYVLARVMGCPCCGPVWYRNLAVGAFTDLDQPIPPELQR